MALKPCLCGMHAAMAAAKQEAEAALAAHEHELHSRPDMSTLTQVPAAFQLTHDARQALHTTLRRWLLNDPMSGILQVQPTLQQHLHMPWMPAHQS